MGGHQVESLSCVNLRVHECLEGMKTARSWKETHKPDFQFRDRTDLECTSLVRGLEMSH